MAEATSRRRGFGEDSIYFVASRNRYVGAVSIGYTADGKRCAVRSLGGPNRKSGTSSRRCTLSWMPESGPRPGIPSAERSMTGCGKAWTAAPSARRLSTQGCSVRCSRLSEPSRCVT